MAYSKVEIKESFDRLFSEGLIERSDGKPADESDTTNATMDYLECEANRLRGWLCIASGAFISTWAGLFIAATFWLAT